LADNGGWRLWRERMVSNDGIGYLPGVVLRQDVELEKLKKGEVSE
jgi:hypothetical protein